VSPHLPLVLVQVNELLEATFWNIASQGSFLGPVRVLTGFESGIKIEDPLVDVSSHASFQGPVWEPTWPKVI